MIYTNQQLTISFPVDRENANMKKMLKKEEAEEILGLFQSDGAKWIEKPQLRVKNTPKSLIVAIELKLRKSQEHYSQRKN